MSGRSSPVEKEGYMWVKRHTGVNPLKSWQWTYAVLRKSPGYQPTACLEWYDSLDSFLMQNTPKSMKFDTINYVGSLKNAKKEFAFILFVDDEKQVHMATRSDAERAEWIRTLDHYKHRQSNGAQQHPVRDSRTSFRVKFKNSLPPSNMLSDRVDYLMNISQNCITLSATDFTGQQRRGLSWPLETIRSYNSCPSETPPTQLLSIETGRQSSTGERVFYFLTSCGDQITDQIRLITKKTYLKKVNSKDNFNVVYGSSPELPSPRLPPSPPRGSMSTKLSVRRREHSAIPFHEYDRGLENNRDSFANYIRQDDGYIHVLTEQEKVERSRRESRRESSQRNVHRSPTSADDDQSTYITLSKEDPTYSDEDRPCYIEVLGDDDSEDENVQSRLSESEHPVYIEVLGDDEERSGNAGNSGGDGQCVPRGEVLRHDEVRHDLHHEVRQVEIRHDEVRHDEVRRAMIHHDEVRHDEVRHEIRHVANQTKESVSSIGSLRLQSVTSQTSSVEYSSVSSECEVFRHENISCTCDVFQDEKAKSEDSCRQLSEDSSVLEAFERPNNSFREESKKFRENFGQIPENNNNHNNKPENFVPHSEDRAVLRRNEIPDFDDETEGTNSAKPYREKSSKTKSWHSETGSEALDTLETREDSTDSTSTSDESRELSDEEIESRPRHNSDSSLRTGSPRSSFTDAEEKQRPRSKTESESTLDYSPDFLKHFMDQIINPQGFVSPSNHRPLQKEASLGEDVPDAGSDLHEEVVAQLTNPIAASKDSAHSVSGRSRGKGRQTAGEIRYMCSECGWHKITRKKHFLNKKSKSVKHCARCNHVISKSKPAKSPKKERSSSLLNRFVQSIKGPAPSVEDFEIVRPEWTPKPPPEPSFVKKLKGPIMPHNPSVDPKRCHRGIAPSPATRIQALTLRGDNPRTQRNPLGDRDSTSPIQKSSLSQSLSDDSVSTGSISPPPVGTPERSKTPLTQTRSSPICSGASESKCDTLTVKPPGGEPKPPRRNSGNTLPPLPEVENTAGDQQNVSPTSGHELPPAIPPRTREEAPPVPPRSVPMSRGQSGKLKRAQTDPTNCLSKSVTESSVLLEKNRVSRTMTDPGNEKIPNENIRNAVSLGNLVEDNREPGAKGTLIKVMSLSLGDDLDNAEPPPLPPRRGSGQAQSPQPLSPQPNSPQPPPVSPRRASNDKGRTSSDLEAESYRSSEPSRQLPENGCPGRPSPKLPLTAKRSLEARRNFQRRNPLYSEHVSDA